MAQVVVDHFGFRVGIEGGQVFCTDGPLLKLCKVMARLAAPSGADPNPDLTIARYITEHIGGSIVIVPQTEYNPNMVY